MLFPTRVEGKMTTVADIIDEKGNQVHGIRRTATVLEAIGKMVEHGVGSLVVMDEAAPCGILTERHYLERVALKGRTSRTTRVEEIMSPEVICVPQDSSIEACMAIMTENRVRQLPVLGEDGELCGIVSIGDVVKRLARERASEVQYLTDYIHGSTRVVAERRWSVAWTVPRGAV
jgi:CBS domain-containing protein